VQPVGSFWYCKVGLQKLSGFLCDGSAVHRLQLYTLSSRKQLFYYTQKCMGAREPNKVHGNGFGNPFSRALWVHFVNFSYHSSQLTAETAFRLYFFDSLWLLSSAFHFRSQEPCNRNVTIVKVLRSSRGFLVGPRGGATCSRVTRSTAPRGAWFGGGSMAMNKHLSKGESMMLKRQVQEDRIALYEGIKTSDKKLLASATWEMKTNAKIAEMGATRRFNQLRLSTEAALDARRQRLAEMLARENEGYVAEIQAIAETPDDMRSRLEKRSKVLKDRREAERVKFVEDMNYKKWRAGCDDLRDADSKNFLLACHLERDKQVLEKLGRQELEERENKLFDALWEEMRQAQVVKETEAEKVLAAKNEDVKKVIAEQLEAIAARRAEDAKILEQEAEIQKEIWALEAQEERRKAVEAAEAQFARNQVRAGAAGAACASGRGGGESTRVSSCCGGVWRGGRCVGADAFQRREAQGARGGAAHRARARPGLPRRGAQEGGGAGGVGERQEGGVRRGGGAVPGAPQSADGAGGQRRGDARPVAQRRAREGVGEAYGRVGEWSDQSLSGRARPKPARAEGRGWPGVGVDADVHACVRAQSRRASRRRASG
jgi:hypothetical protein